MRTSFQVAEAFQEDRDTGRNLDTASLRKNCRPAEYGRSVNCTSQKDRIVNPLESELLKFEIGASCTIARHHLASCGSYGCADAAPSSMVSLPVHGLRSSFESMEPTLDIYQFLASMWHSFIDFNETRAGTTQSRNHQGVLEAQRRSDVSTQNGDASELRQQNRQRIVKA